MTSLSAKIDEFALRKGNAEGKVKLYRDRPLVMFIVEGLIVGAPIVFWDSGNCQVALVCRISHLDSGETERASLLSALSSSLSAWMGLPDGHGVQVRNPSVFICSCDTHEAYDIAEFLMDKAWLDVTALSLYPWCLSHVDEGARLAAGIRWRTPGRHNPYCHHRASATSTVCLSECRVFVDRARGRRSCSYPPDRCVLAQKRLWGTESRPEVPSLLDRS